MTEIASSIEDHYDDWRLSCEKSIKTKIINRLGQKICSCDQTKSKSQ